MRLVNVNLPEKPNGIRWKRLAIGEYDGKVVRSKDPTGRPIFWFAVKPLYDESRGNESLACNYAVTTRSHCRKGSRSRAVGESMITAF